MDADLLGGLGLLARNAHKLAIERDANFVQHLAHQLVCLLLLSLTLYTAVVLKIQSAEASRSLDRSDVSAARAV